MKGCPLVFDSVSEGIETSYWVTLVLSFQANRVKKKKWMGRLSLFHLWANGSLARFRILEVQVMSYLIAELILC